MSHFLLNEHAQTQRYLELYKKQMILWALHETNDILGLTRKKYPTTRSRILCIIKRTRNKYNLKKYLFPIRLRNRLTFLNLRTDF